MSDTPETFMAQDSVCYNGKDWMDFVPVKFAERLERERDQLKALLSEVLSRERKLLADRLVLECERDHLKTLLKKALSLLAEVTTAHRDPDDLQYNDCVGEPCAFCEETEEIRRSLVK